VTLFFMEDDDVTLKNGFCATPHTKKRPEPSKPPPKPQEKRKQGQAKGTLALCALH
jgi:hypothetical protein